MLRFKNWQYQQNLWLMTFVQVASHRTSMTHFLQDDPDIQWWGCSFLVSQFLGILLFHLHLLTCLTQQQWAIRIWCLGFGICWHVGVQILTCSRTEKSIFQASWELIKLDGSWSNKHSGFFQLLLTIHPLPSIVMAYLPTFTAFTIKKNQPNKRSIYQSHGHGIFT